MFKSIFSFISHIICGKNTTTSKLSDSQILSVLQHTLAQKITCTFQDSKMAEPILSLRTGKDLEYYIKNYFVAFCHFGIISSSLIEEFASFFRAVNIHANTCVIDGYLLVDDHNLGTAYGDSTGVAIQNGEIIGEGRTKLHGYNYSTVSANYKSHAECWDKSSLHLYGHATGEAWDNVIAYAWDDSHIIGHDVVEITALGNSTYEIDGNATVIKALRNIASENTPTSNQEEVEIWEETEKVLYNNGIYPI